jgi:hypothetical protein
MATQDAGLSDHDAVPAAVIPAPFEGLWSATDLGAYRPCSATYNGYTIESLPPLDRVSFTGEFAWRGEAGDVLEAEAAAIGELAEELAEAGLELPADFVTYMTRSDLHGFLDEVSCTANWTHLSAAIPSPVEPDARLVCFFRDQQDCVLWYLYLRPNGESFVVHSFRDLEWEAGVAADPGADPDLVARLRERFADPASDIFWCAPTVEVFAYRYWMENVLWLALNDGVSVDKLDDAQRAYLEHYSPAQ